MPTLEQAAADYRDALARYREWLATPARDVPQGERNGWPEVGARAAAHVFAMRERLLLLAETVEAY